MTYGQFCPIAKAAEVVAERWSLIIIREVLAGTKTFNDLRRALPLISPALLSHRLVELEDAEVILKAETGKRRPKYEYLPSSSALDLGPILMQLGDWGNKWVGSNLEKGDYDPRLLMWDIHRNIDLEHFREHDRYVVEFEFSGLKRSLSHWWLVIEGETVDICMKNPGHEIQLTVRSDIHLMVELWMGWQTLAGAKRGRLIHLEGRTRDVRAFSKWFKLNAFAHRPALASA